MKEKIDKLDFIKMKNIYSKKYTFKWMNKQATNWDKIIAKCISDKAAAAAKSLQSCPTLWDPMDCRLPGSSVHGIFQARVLEWGAIAFSDLIKHW